MPPSLPSASLSSQISAIYEKPFVAENGLSDRSLMPLHRTGAACLCRGSGAQPGASVLSVQFCCKPAVMTHERTARAEVNKTLSASCAGKQADAAVHGHGGHLLSRRLPWTAAQFRGIAHFLRVCGQRRRRRRQASENDCTHPRG